MNLFKASQAKELDPRLAWINEPQSWRFNDGILHVDVPEAADFFEDPAGVNVRASAPFLYCEAEGDFSLTARVDVDMQGAYDSACVMVMADAKHWAKLCFELVKGIPTIVSVVTKEVSDNCISEKVAGARPYLKILRAGNCFGFHYSLDAVDWTLIRFFRIDAHSKLKVGVVAQCPAGSGTRVRIESFDFDARKIASAKIVA